MLQQLVDEKSFQSSAITRSCQRRTEENSEERRVKSEDIMTAISQFFILSPRGDCIISKDYRGDETPTMHEDFFRQVCTVTIVEVYDVYYTYYDGVIGEILGQG